MIIQVSIADTRTRQHIGTYSFEIDYPSDSAEYIDFLTVAVPSDYEEKARKWVGRLITDKEIAAENITHTKVEVLVPVSATQIDSQINSKDLN